MEITKGSSSYVTPAVCRVVPPACVQQALSEAKHLLWDPLLDYIDLCSTANVSVLALATQRFGYYVHGQCVHGASDVSLAMWYDNFRAEEARSRLSLSLSLCKVVK